MKFNTSDLKDFLEGAGPDDWEEIEEEFLDKRRWYLSIRKIFKVDDKFFEFIYHDPATECQEWEPFSCGKDWIDCQEVIPTQVTITKYVKV